MLTASDFPKRNLGSKKEFSIIRWIPGVELKVGEADKI
jgi:hypothetical protein